MRLFVPSTPDINPIRKPPKINNVDLTVKVKVEDYGVLNNNVTIGNKTSSVNITVPEINPNKTRRIFSDFWR